MDVLIFHGREIEEQRVANVDLHEESYIYLEVVCVCASLSSKVIKQYVSNPGGKTDVQFPPVWRENLFKVYNYIFFH